MIDLYVNIDIIDVLQYNLDNLIVEQLSSIIEINQKQFIPFDENSLKD